MPRLDEILGVAYAQIPEDLKKKYKDIDLVDSSNYIEKKELDAANNSITEYKKQLKDRDQQLINLKDKVKDSEELSQEIEKLKADNEKVAKDYEDKLNEINFENKIEKKLGDFKPKNLGILKKALDFEKISLDGDNFLGLEEQIKNLKESDAYLFEEENKGGTGSLGGGQSSFTDESKGAKSIGEILAESKKTNQNSEAQDKFFE
ncbi:putative scaffold protein [uncultured Caudovirales phage]|uniref:Putative scaffold protein n=1 Tax=uncultured Caudovirales phage TaxID=2100421 RepID=A0A2H4J024_9CAUD|nr:putative scaffold protein [uncultured Caudovirales phage]